MPQLDFSKKEINTIGKTFFYSEEGLDVIVSGRLTDKDLIIKLEEEEEEIESLVWVRRPDGSTFPTRIEAISRNNNKEILFHEAYIIPELEWDAEKNLT